MQQILFLRFHFLSSNVIHPAQAQFQHSSIFKKGKLQTLQFKYYNIPFKISVLTCLNRTLKESIIWNTLTHKQLLN